MAGGITQSKMRAPLSSATEWCFCSSAHIRRVRFAVTLPLDARTARAEAEPSMPIRLVANTDLLSATHGTPPRAPVSFGVDRAAETLVFPRKSACLSFSHPQFRQCRLPLDLRRGATPKAAWAFGSQPDRHGSKVRTFGRSRKEDQGHAGPRPTHVRACRNVAGSLQGVLLEAGLMQ